MGIEVEMGVDLRRAGRPIPPGPRAPAPPPRVLLRPSAGWRAVDLAELWQGRELIGFLVWRDVKVRYKQTALGAAWAVLQPLMMMVVFTAFFGRLAGVAPGGVPYSLFAYAGLLPWTSFATAVAAAGNSVVGSERLITKVYFPRLAIPLAAVGSAVVDFVAALGLLAAMMAYHGVAPGPGLVAAPLIYGLIVLTALGIGTGLAALNVAYRDFRHAIPFLIQLGMFATPTVYMPQDAGTGPLAGGGGVLRTLLDLNPMTPLIAAFRAATLGGPIAWDRVALSAAASLALLAAGCLYYRKVEGDFADVV